MEAAEPKTLQEAILYFANPANCRQYLVARRWPNGVICPRCGSQRVAFLEKYNRWQCSAPHAARQFTSKTGTIFEDSPISLDKWLLAMWQVVNCKNGVSSYEIHRAIGVTQKTAWFMDHRIRLALGMEPGPKFTCEIEADETFIGGKARNMHASKRARRITGTGGKDKAAFMGILERGADGKTSKVRTTVVSNRKRKALHDQQWLDDAIRGLDESIARHPEIFPKASGTKISCARLIVYKDAPGTPSVLHLLCNTGSSSLRGI